MTLKSQTSQSGTEFPALYGHSDGGSSRRHKLNGVTSRTEGGAVVYCPDHEYRVAAATINPLRAQIHLTHSGRDKIRLRFRSILSGALLGGRLGHPIESIEARNDGDPFPAL